MDETAKDIAVIQKQIENICEKHEDLEQIVIEEKKRLNHNLERIGAKMEVQTELLMKACHLADTKPTWGTTIALTTLVGAVVGLATFLLTH